MSFWETFVKVWQVRTSIRIQEDIEESVRIARENANTQANMPKIVEEVQKKNASWNDQLNKYRSEENLKD